MTCSAVNQNVRPSFAFLAFVALDEFLKQKKMAFVGKNHNWPVPNNQMSKPISEWDSDIKFTVIAYGM